MHGKRRISTDHLLCAQSSGNAFLLRSIYQRHFPQSLPSGLQGVEVAFTSVVHFTLECAFALECVWEYLSLSDGCLRPECTCQLSERKHQHQLRALLVFALRSLPTTVRTRGNHTARGTIIHVLNERKRSQALTSVFLPSESIFSLPLLL